jgi:hypothetical protein
MKDLRELIESQPKLMSAMAANAFINELKDVDSKAWNVITAYCDSAIQDVDLLKIALGQTLHYEERAKAVLRAVDAAIVCEVNDYIADKLADFDEEDESEVMDDEDLKTKANSLSAYDLMGMK